MIEPQSHEFDPRPSEEWPDGIIDVRGRTFDWIEREVYAYALRQHGGRRRKAARALGIPRSTFADKVIRFGLAGEGEQPKSPPPPPEGGAAQ